MALTDVEEGLPGPSIAEERPPDVSLGADANTPYEFEYASGKLSLLEIDWRDRFERIKSSGYLLRPRFRPGWKPSWEQSGANRFLAEDFFDHGTQNAIDAIRMKDNTTVMIKRITKGRDSYEYEIGEFFTNLNNPRDPRNHCVPILDSFEVDGDEAVYIVMPLLRDFDDPPFYSVKEVIEFVLQTLEATKFMHDHLVAHRDLSTYNIMMDGTPLYPAGFHPSRQNRSRDATRFLNGRLRLYSKPVFYYIIDFGLSKKYEGDGPYEATGIIGQDRDAPELHARGEIYDPFLLDIFTLGNVYNNSLLHKYKNLEFLTPLVEKMTQRRPEDRPSIAEAISMFEPIYAARERLSCRKRLRPYHEGLFTRFFRDIVATYRDAGHLSCYFFLYWYHVLTFRRPWKS